jgi:hypothetical protein
MNDKTWFLEKAAKYRYQGQRPFDPLNEAENIFSIFAAMLKLSVDFLASLLNVSRYLRRIALSKIPFKYMTNGLFKMNDLFWHRALLNRNWVLISDQTAVFILNPLSSGQREIGIISIPDLWFAHTKHYTIEFGEVKRLRNMAHALMRLPPANNTKHLIHITFSELLEHTFTGFRIQSKKREHSRWKTSLLKLPDINAAWKVLIANRSTHEIIDILGNGTAWTVKKPPTKRPSELESLSSKRLKTRDIMIE